MRHLMWIKVLIQNLKSKDGVTAIEYGLIAALIAVAIIVAVTLVGTNLQLTFNMIAGHLGSSPH
jgi:pilus assembly protein Flp/PilA